MTALPKPTLIDWLTTLIENAPGVSKTDKVVHIAKATGIGRTHLYEILAGHRQLNSLPAAKKLYALGVPAEVLLE